MHLPRHLRFGGMLQRSDNQAFPEKQAKNRHRQRVALEGADSLPWECGGHLQAGDQICLWALQLGLGLALQPGFRSPSWGSRCLGRSLSPHPHPRFKICGTRA